MDEYVAVSNPTGGRQVEYRLNRVGMERHGRWQSLTSTVKVFLVLLVLQYPMRQAAVGTWDQKSANADPATGVRVRECLAAQRISPLCTGIV